tara:strand:+ start:2301 stop:2765 length:465 start_codon:yes stop_codon:yes gene_type:complete
VTEIRFYHLQRSALEHALPKLLEKTLERGWRAVVMTGSEDRVEALNTVLWNYAPEGFLPHGSKKDGYSERQPVWLTDQDENPNAAVVLFLVDGAKSERISEFELCCEIFDGRDDDAVAVARKHWKLCMNSEFSLTYWQQTEEGAWEKKAEKAAL